MESQQKKTAFPKAVGFIVANEFCERFSYYGMRTILSLYLRDKLGFADDGATVVYHVFSMFAYFFPLVGAIIADGWLGRYKTIFYLSLVYAAGSILLSFTSMPPLGLPKFEFTVIALLLVAFGTGGIKPCVSAFGGDQFKIPEQEKYLGYFFSLFYFAINAGSLVSTFLTPILRKDVHCFGDYDCYSLAFGVPGILMIVAIVLFVAGKRKYKIKNPSGNILIKVTKCVSHAVVTKVKTKTKRHHWLDHADDKYDTELIDDIKALFRVLVLFIPLPVFWALFDQQGSRWTFQADRMDQAIGGWELKADQMQVLNPLLILIFIPLFEVAIYPAMTWCRLISKPLHRMIWGGILAALAFCVSGIVELQLVPTYGTPVTDGLTQLRVYNGLDCSFKLTYGDYVGDIKPLSGFEKLDIPAKSSIDLPYSLQAVDSSSACGKLQTTTGTFNLQEKTAHGFFINSKNILPFKDNNDKTINGINVRFLTTIEDKVTIELVNKKGATVLTQSSDNTQQKKIPGGTYNLLVNKNTILKEYKLKTGAVYTVVINDGGNSKYTAEVLEITPPNTIHILWLVPQYVIITMGEVMFSVTGLEFSFTQAPVSMKSVLTSIWLLTVAFGNLIVVLIVEGNFLDAQWKEFFLFAGLMLLDMMIFTFMALRYKYVVYKSSNENIPGEEIKLPEKPPTNNQ